MAADDSLATARLPAKQLAILAVARFAEPLAYTSVFPYLPEMIRDFGVPQNKIAMWAGLTSAVFSLAQSVTAVPWGKAADHYGRKPVLILGLLCTMACFVVWGMSTSLAMAITIRAIQGGSNGNVGIIRTMVAEMVPQKELQPRAFSIMPLVWSLGSVIGPSFGGFFAQPARQFPRLFGRLAYFRRFPYALPNLVATVFFFVSVASAAFFLHETLASKRGKRDWGLLVGQRLTRALCGRRRRRGATAVAQPQFSHRRGSFADGEATAPLIPFPGSPSEPRRPRRSSAAAPAASYPSGMSAVFTRQTVIALLVYSFLAFHSVAYDQNVTVLLNYELVERRTPANTRLPFYFTGGFGLSSGRIGTIFTLYGITGGLIQFLVYPPLVSRFGVLRCLKICLIIAPPVYMLTPYTVLASSDAGRLVSLFSVMVLKALFSIVAFPSITIILTNSCTSLRVLGTLNGFATTFSGIGRALGPMSTGLVFDAGAERGYVVAAYFFLAAVAIVGAVPAFFIVEGPGPYVAATAASSASPSGARDSQESTIVLEDQAIEEEDDDDYDDEGSDSTALGSSPSSPLLQGRSSGYFDKHDSRRA